MSDHSESADSEPESWEDADFGEYMRRLNDSLPEGAEIIDAGAVPLDWLKRGPTSGEPPTKRGMEATLKVEDVRSDGEAVGPLVLWDPDACAFVWQSAEWLGVLEARRLADGNGWSFHIDG